MLDLGSSDDVGWQTFWYSLRDESNSYYARDPKKIRNFRSGEIVHAEGVVITDFYKFLIQHGYELSEGERRIFNHCSLTKDNKAGKPVVVLRRLGDGNYLVCRMSSFGGKKAFEKTMSPMQRYFAFSTSATAGEWPIGEKILRTSPPAIRSSVVIMLPFVTKDITPFEGLDVRIYLRLGQLERLEEMIMKRLASFHSDHSSLRSDELLLQQLIRLPERMWTDEMRREFTSRRLGGMIGLDDELDVKYLPDEPLYYRRTSRLPGLDLFRYPEKAPPKPARRPNRVAPRLPVLKELNPINWAYAHSFHGDAKFDVPISQPKSGFNPDHTMYHYLPRGKHEIKADRQSPAQISASPQIHTPISLTKTEGPEQRLQGRHDPAKSKTHKVSKEIYHPPNFKQASKDPGPGLHSLPKAPPSDAKSRGALVNSPSRVSAKAAVKQVAFHIPLPVPASPRTHSEQKGTRSAKESPPRSSPRPPLTNVTTTHRGPGPDRRTLYTSAVRLARTFRWIGL